MAMRTNTAWRVLLMLVMIAGLFFLGSFVPRDSVRWSFVVIAIALVPWFLFPFAMNYWFGAEKRIAPDRWIALAIAIVLVLAAAFWPSAFLERLLSFSRSRRISFSETRHLILAASLLVLMVIFLAACAIVRKYQKRKR